jgi:AraC-like DNA-binding protein
MKRQSGNEGPPVARQARTEATVRVGGALGIPDVLRSLGADPAEVLAEVGFDLDVFNDPDLRVSYAARGRLFHHCVARTGCAHFGLLVGQRGGLHTLGLLGLLAKYSPDVGTALRGLVRYGHLHVRGARVTLAEEGKLATFGYDIYEPQLTASDQNGDGAVATMFNIVRSLCGSDWEPVELRFAHRRPEDVGPFKRFFQAPLVFDAEQYAVAFPADWLHRPLASDDPELRRLLQKQVDALEEMYGDDFPQQVRNVLRTALLTGHAKADQVAALFAVHPRTLHRRLNAFGTGYRDMVDACRFQIAAQMLEDSALEIGQVAAMLDYANASAFTRAFRRWSGTTPANWRASRKEQAGSGRK